MAANDGLITADDLAGYRALERSPVRGTFNEFEIVSVAPPSSGGVHVLQMLNLLEPYPLQILRPQQCGIPPPAHREHEIGLCRSQPLPR